MVRDHRIAIVLFLFLLSAYLLTYSGLLHSDDEMSMLAVTESLVKRGSFTIDQIAWNQDQAGGIGRYGIDGHLYSKYGWGQSVLAIPLYLLGMVVPVFGLIQTTMLFNSIVTALTGSFIYLVARRLRFSIWAGLLCSLLFAFMTIAWVYAKYFFTEPLTALLTVGAFYFLARKDSASGNRDYLWAGILLGLSVAVKSASAVLLPFFYFLPVIAWVRDSESEKRLLDLFQRLMLLSVPIAIFGISVGIYNYVRFGNPFDAGYNPDETFNGDLVVGVYGLLFSPGKSLFLYSPILFSFFLGFPAFFRRYRTESLVALAIIVSTILLYGKWHAWHGGWGWGPRFLVPIIPFLLLGALPFLEDMLRRKSLVLIIPFSIVAAVSFLVVLLGVSADFNLYLLDVMNQHPEFRAGAMFFTIMDAARSPIVGQLSYVFSGNLDFVWAHMAGNRFSINLPLAFLSFGLFALLAFALAFITRRETSMFGNLQIGEKSERQLYTLKGRYTLAAFIGATFLVAAGTLYAAFGDDRLNSGNDVNAQLLEFLSTKAKPTDALIVCAPSLTQFMMNYDKARYEVYSLLREFPPLRPRVEQWLEEIRLQHQKVWLFQENAPYADPSLAIETWLDKETNKTDNKWFGQSRLALYSTDDEFVQDNKPNLVLGDSLLLEDFAVTEAKPAGILGMRFLWRALRDDNPHYASSLRVVDAQGTAIVQKDREFTDSLAPTSTWRKDQDIQDRMGLSLPSDIKPGIYSIMMVVYNINGIQPLRLEDGSQLILLGTVEIK